MFLFFFTTITIVGKNIFFVERRNLLKLSIAIVHEKESPIARQFQRIL